MKKNDLMEQIHDVTVETEDSSVLFKNKLEDTFSPIYHLMVLRAKTFIKSPGMVFAFIMPLIYLIILGSVTPNLNQQLGALITMNIMSTIIFSFGQVMAQWKESVVIKRIGATPIKKSQFIITMLMFSFLFVTLSIMWTLGFAAFFEAIGLFGSVTNKETGISIPKEIYWSHVDFGALILGVIITIALTFGVATIFVSISSSSEIYSTMAMLYYMVSLFGGGLMFTPDMVAGTSAEWLTYLGYILPHSWSAQWIMSSFGGIRIDPNISSSVESNILSPWDFEFDNHIQIPRLVIPLVLAPIYGMIGIKLFSWED